MGISEGSELHNGDVVLEESVVLPGEDKARTSKLVPSGKLVEYLFEDARTQVEMMDRGCRESGNGRCVGWRNAGTEYFWLTYKEFMTRAKNFGSGLKNFGVNLGQSTFIGITGRNSPEWLIAQHGCFNYSSPVVPLYESLGPDALSYMINKGEIKLIVCDTLTKAEGFLSRIEETPSLKHIVCATEAGNDLLQLAKKKGVGLYSFESVEIVGRLKPIPRQLPKPDDLAIVCFTSGTTGSPKGAMLTHGNSIAGASAVILQMGSAAMNKNSVMISYLPLAHVMEQTIEVAVFMMGGCIGFFRGDINNLVEDMQVLQPTFFPAVPRLLNKLYDKAQALAKRNNLKNEVDTTNEKTDKHNSIPIFDRNLYQNFRKSLGGKIKLIVTAAAPISDVVLTFYIQALGCNVVEIYGQTECAGPITLNVLSEKSIGNVGPPIPSCIVKLVKDPYIGYKEENNIGEICLKGHNVCKGYLKEPEITAETIDEDGWLHTGDIGMWLPNGTLRVLDRKKHMFKLSQGEFVAPEKVENIYLKSRFISQILVHGESIRSFLVAIVVPDQEVLSSWCSENSKCLSWSEMCTDPDIKKLILDDMKSIADSSGLLSFEQVKKIYLHPKLLTIEDGHLTPTFKTKRDTCRKYFAKEIHDLYGESDY